MEEPEIMSSPVLLSPPATRQDFPIVGIGASAGGLKAFKEFLSVIPADSGMSYVFVQHLHPGHDSVLPELLAQISRIPVLEITDEIHLAPNHVYVIPENKLLTSTDGVLRLSARVHDAKNSAIDIFFCSLAEVHLELAVGVLLSGTGNDGTIGLLEIKKHGGKTFVQNSDSATFPEMPLHAEKAGAADYVLNAEEMPKKIAEVMHPQFVAKTEDTAYAGILHLLNLRSGVDFTYYKQSTIRRRIARRRGIIGCPSMSSYLSVLTGDETAQDVLFNDLLIPVTSFFRDPLVFAEIDQHIFPDLIRKKSDSDPIRIWVAGCSTGKEAYSLAIALKELSEASAPNIQIKIFASDVSELSIAKARLGVYPAKEVADISAPILKKYFTKTKSGFSINKEIRELCVFAVHNFLKDPPFARMDLISCRNVLIYMDMFLQKKALKTFHYALADGGFLLLGKSETAFHAEDLFIPLIKTGKMYLKKITTNSMKKMPSPNPSVVKAGSIAYNREVFLPDYVKSAHALLLSDFTPGSVVISEHLDILQIFGNVSPYLELAPGKPTFNLMRVAREGLKFELRNAIQKVRKNGSSYIKDDIPVNYLKEVNLITIELRCLTNTADPCYIVVFKPSPHVASEAPVGTYNESADSFSEKRIQALESQLLLLQADANRISDAQDAANDELQSANEELLSSSEELQSLNEELETSKEELQSSNEELVIINRELLIHQDIINLSKKYTEAIVATLREPIVVLDVNLRIRNVNRSFIKKYNITKPEAKGKLIYEINNHLFDNPMMRSMLEQVLPQKTQIDDFQISIDLGSGMESIMLLNARQVTTERNGEQLILLAIEDITERVLTERRLKALSNGFELKVAERTADLLASNERLESTVQELHDVNVRLQEYAYVASHDLQEPLRKIQMFISRLRQIGGECSKEEETLLDKITSSSARMSRLIQDLLAFSYLSQEDKKFIPTDLNLIVDNILIDFELWIEEQNAVIEIGPLPMINAIPMQMNQLFYNLISNALKFHKSDGSISKIAIKSRALSPRQVAVHKDLDPSLKYCEIIIQDNGIGFDEKYVNKIFVIFQRLHSSESYTGTGIGLAIGKKIIENHKGIIFSRAKEGIGAAFHIMLPYSQVEV